MYDLETNFFNSMEHYDRYGSRSDSSTAHAQRVEGIHAQRKLPSFRDIIPAHLHNAIDSNPPAATDLQSPDPSSSSVQGGTATSRSIAPSPVQSQTGSMQALNDGYEDFSNRGEGGYVPHQQSRHVPDHTTTWIPSAQYTEVPMSIMPHQPSYPQQISPVSRTSPGLPSIRDIHTRTDRVQNGFESTYGMPGFQYPSMYSNSQVSGTDIENGHYGQRRTAHVESNQRHRPAYPNMNRQYSAGVAEYPRYANSHYDQYRGQNTYQTHYSEIDYVGQGMHAPQHANFGVMGEPGSDRNKRRRGNLPKPVTDLLKQWLHDHLDHPYPTEEDKQFFIARTGLTISQISNWFINARRRQVPSIKSNRDRPSHGGLVDHRSVDRLRSSHDPSLSPR